jgi:hypothetical protein
MKGDLSMECSRMMDRDMAAAPIKWSYPPRFRADGTPGSNFAAAARPVDCASGQELFDLAMLATQ